MGFTANGQFAYSKLQMSEPEAQGDASKASATAQSNRSARSSKAKFAVLLATMFLVSFSNNIVTAVIHDHIPQYPPLPDVVFAVFDEARSFVMVTEVCIVIGCLIALPVMLISPKRWLYLSRVAYIATMLYLGRAVCMGVTLLPVTSPTYACISVPNNRTTMQNTWLRIRQSFFSFGFESTGESINKCGDHIYSGHAVVAVLCSLVVNEYGPKRLSPVLPILSFLLSTVAVFGILVTRLHYTIDVILAYFLTTRLFWAYHHSASAISNAQRVVRRGDLISAVFWYPIVDFIERDGFFHGL